MQERDHRSYAAVNRTVRVNVRSYDTDAITTVRARTLISLTYRCEVAVSPAEKRRKGRIFRVLRGPSYARRFGSSGPESRFIIELP